MSQIREARGLEEEEPLPVDVVMVSHVDDDHIKGILDLTKEQRGKSPDVRLKVTSLWHNSFDDLLTTKPDELKATAGLVPRRSGGGGGGGSEAFDSGSVLAGFGKAALAGGDVEERRRDCRRSRCCPAFRRGGRCATMPRRSAGKLNHKFKGKLILATKASKPVTLEVA